MDVMGLEADISDDIGFCSAQVKNVSRYGIRLCEMSRKLRVRGDKFLIVISGKGHRFKIQAQSKWEDDHGIDTVIGAEIINAPWSWTVFIDTMEPAENDLWNTYNDMMA